MIERYRRFSRLWRSRHQELRGVIGLQTLEQITAWSERNSVVGFNGSPIRFRILYSAVKAFGATEFLETGTYHGATALCASKSLQIPVYSCEAVATNAWVARILTFGLPSVHIAHERSEHWLPAQVRRLKEAGVARPVFYLDAHAGIDPTSCPIVEELSSIFELPNFLIVIDDFAVPKSDFVGRIYGRLSLGLDLVWPALGPARIKKVYLPCYPSQLESGHARAGFAVLFRSAGLENILDRREFPFDLLRAYSLDDEQAA